MANTDQVSLEPFSPLASARHQRLRENAGQPQHRCGPAAARTALAALLLIAAPVAVAGDWKGELAKKAIGSAVRAGLEDAARDAALAAAMDAAWDAARHETVNDAASRLDDLGNYADVGHAVGDGVDFAMRAADVADRLDNVADAAKVAKKIGKLKKLKR